MKKQAYLEHKLRSPRTTIHGLRGRRQAKDKELYTYQEEPRREHNIHQDIRKDNQPTHQQIGA